MIWIRLRHSLRADKRQSPETDDGRVLGLSHKSTSYPMYFKTNPMYFKTNHLLGYSFNWFFPCGGISEGIDSKHQRPRMGSESASCEVDIFTVLLH